MARSRYYVDCARNVEAPFIFTEHVAAPGDETPFQNVRQNVQSVMLCDVRPEIVGRANALQKL